MTRIHQSEMMQVLISQLSLQTIKDSQEEIEEYKRVVSDMTNSIASVIKDIVPQPLDLDV